MLPHTRAGLGVGFNRNIQLPSIYRFHFKASICMSLLKLVVPIYQFKNIWQFYTTDISILQSHMSKQTASFFDFMLCPCIMCIAYQRPLVSINTQGCGYVKTIDMATDNNIGLVPDFMPCNVIVRLNIKKQKGSECTQPSMIPTASA